MSKKTLLEEGTIRQFMKYANIGGLTENFISETYGEEEVVEEAAEVVEEEAVEEGMGHYAEEEEGIEPMGDDLPVDDVPVDDAPVDDFDAEEEAIADTSEASVEALVDALADTITQVTGVEVTAAGDEEAGVPADAAPELPGDEGPVDDVAAAPVGDEEEVLDETEVIDEDSIVNETMKRVMARLQTMKRKSAKAKKHEELIEAVAAAVEKRLASK